MSDHLPPPSGRVPPDDASSTPDLPPPPPPGDDRAGDPPPPPPGFETTVVDPAADPVGPRRRGGVMVLAVVAVIAIVAAGVFAISRMRASADGGADSPEALGEAFLAALEDEDLLGLVDLLLPGERAVFGDPGVEILKELERLGVMGKADLSSLPGVEIDLENEKVEVVPTNVADIATVHFSADSTVSVDGSKVPIGELIENRFDPADLAEIRDLRDTARELLEGHVVAVEHNGRWYISLMYAIAEQIRGDADIPVSGIGSEGSKNPEDAVTDMLTAFVELDIRQIIQRLNPGEAGALQRYAPLFIDDAESLLADVLPFEYRIEVTDSDIRIEGSGDVRHAFVDLIELSGVIDGERVRVRFEDGCLRVEAAGETFEQCQSDPGEALDTFEEQLGDVGGMSELLDALLSAYEDAEAPGLQLRESGGEWYVSPIGTMTEAVLAVLRALDSDELERIIDAVIEVGESSGDRFGTFGFDDSGFGPFDDVTSDSIAAPAATTLPEPVETTTLPEPVETTVPEPVETTTLPEPVEDASSVGVFELRIGDCFQDPSADGAISGVAVVPCDQPHDNEVFFAFDVDPGDYPGEDALTDIADERCVEEFQTYVGSDYAASEYYVTSLTPTEDGWNEIDDREVVCILFLRDEQMVGSAQGTNR